MYASLSGATLIGMCACDVAPGVSTKRGREREWDRGREGKEGGSEGHILRQDLNTSGCFRIPNYVGLGDAITCDIGLYLRWLWLPEIAVEIDR